MVDPIRILQQARALGSQATLADVQAAIAAVDRAPLEANHGARYQVEIWDGESPLCGQPPEYWRARGDWPEGGVVFVLQEHGRPVVVQPHDPETGGLMPMTEEVAEQRGQAMIARKVAEAVDAEVERTVLLQLVP